MRERIHSDDAPAQLSLPRLIGVRREVLHRKSTEAGVRGKHFGNPAGDESAREAVMSKFLNSFALIGDDAVK